MVQTGGDKHAVFAFLCLSGLALPGNYLMTSVLPVAEHEIIATMVSHIFLGLVSAWVLFSISYRPRWYLHHRTFVLSTFFSAIWLLVVATNLRILTLAVQAQVPLLGVGVVCNVFAMCITLHVVLPLKMNQPFLDAAVLAAPVALHVSRHSRPSPCVCTPSMLTPSSSSRAAWRVAVSERVELPGAEGRLHALYHPLDDVHLLDASLSDRPHLWLPVLRQKLSTRLEWR